MCGLERLCEVRARCPAAYWVTSVIALLLAIAAPMLLRPTNLGLAFGPAGVERALSHDTERDTNAAAAVVLSASRAPAGSGLEQGEWLPFHTYLPATSKPCSGSISHIRFFPPSPAALHTWAAVQVQFAHTTSCQGPILMWAIGYAGGQRQPYSPSDRHWGPDTGTTVRQITAFSPAVIDTVVIEMREGDTGRTLFETATPVRFEFQE